MGVFSFVRRVVRRNADGIHSREVEIERRRINNRQGKVFCGQCDVRIATVLLNTVHIFIALLVMIPATVDGPSFENVVLPIAAITLSIISICAAMNFLCIISCFCTFCMFVLFMCYAFTVHIASLILAGVILLSQSFMLHEMLTGSTTKENYVNEEFITDEGRQTLEAVRDFGIDLAASARCLGKEISDETQGVANETKETVDRVVKTSTVYFEPALSLIKLNDSIYSPPVVEC
jgi:hypothetical protein